MGSHYTILEVYCKISIKKCLNPVFLTLFSIAKNEILIYMFMYVVISLENIRIVEEQSGLDEKCKGMCEVKPFMDTYQSSYCYYIFKEMG